MKKLKLMLVMLYEHRLLYLMAFITISLATLFSYTAPLLIKTTIDSLLNDIPLNPSNIIERAFLELGGRDVLKQRLYIPALLLLAFIFCQGIFTFFSKYLAARASEGSIEALRNNLFRNIQRQEFSYFISSATGDLIQRCTSDVDTIRRFLETQFIEIGNTCIMIFIAMGFMFSLHIPLSLIMIPIIPLTIGFSFLFFQKIQRVFTISDESEGRLSEMLSEHLKATRVVKAFGLEPHEIVRFDDLNMDFKLSVQKLINLLGVYWGVSTLISVVQVILILSFGTIWAIQGTVSLGTLQVFLAYVWMILWPLRQLGRILVDMGKSFVAIGRINEILTKVPENINADGVCPIISGHISFQNLSFSYPVSPLSENSRARDEKEQSRQKKVLSNISFDIYPGEIIGILGPTGSGKTTILHLLAGLYSEYEGKIFVDGHELHRLNLLNYRRQLGYVLQEPTLFSGSIKKNIRMGWDQASVIDVERAAREAEIHQSIQDFSMHYHTIVGERGVTLSGGQKQRLAIARALIRRLPVYMFDDSLSSLDAETDTLIRNNIIKRERRATILIVSHRLNTIAGADRIVILEQGRISNIGTHSELSKQPGLYRRLWALQQDEESTERKVNYEKK